MRRIIGALVLFLAALVFRGGGVLSRWIRAPEAELARRPARRVPRDESVLSGGGRRSTAPQEIPRGYIQTPLVFLSTAPADSLVLLPGIGPVLADRIVGARTGKRSFTRWEDLLVVKGIGPKTLDRLKGLTDGTN